jgi:GMP synthase (glutamine-hydrolysing)
VTSPGAGPADQRPLLIVEHATWEGPFRILDSFLDAPVVTHRVLEDDETVLPSPSQVRGAVLMGGPMSVNDADRLPGLAVEMDWIRAAIAARTPVLGICLGAQLIAKAAGAVVAPASTPEVGVSEVEIFDVDDVLVGALAPSIPALHWHGECFDLPPAAVALARSAPTPLQAFRIGEACWGLLFHLEADRAVIDQWLAEPVMAAEAHAVHGAGFATALRTQAALLEPQRAQQVFAAFAARCAYPSPAPVGASRSASFAAATRCG